VTHPPRSDSPRIRAATPSDFAAILAINNAAVPAMNSQDAASLERLVGHAVYLRVVEDELGVAAFLIGMPPRTQYESSNYRWFCDRFAEFLYIDRIAVAARAQRAGLGSLLYADMVDFARGRWPCLVAEVNSDPPNPGSVAFHERHGFTKVGELHHTYEGAHAASVTMLRLEIPSAE
jgi:predicted GNAT superfamily acetyltransferase